MNVLLFLFFLFSFTPHPVHAAARLQYISYGETAFTETSKIRHLCLSEDPGVVLSRQGYIRGGYPGISAVAHMKKDKVKQTTYLVKGILPAEPCISQGTRRSLCLLGADKLSVLSWSSSNPLIASVDEKGLVTGRRPGTVRIFCRLKGGPVYSSTVTVYNAVGSAEAGLNKASGKQGSLILSCEDTTFMLKPDQSYRPRVTVRRINGRGTVPDLVWTSENPDIAKVDTMGRIKALKEGMTVISCQAEDQEILFSVNVISHGESGGSCRLTLLGGNPPEKRTYTLYKQNAHNYDSYDRYLAWHGCAHCSLATVLGAYRKSFEGIKPNEIISGIEKRYAPADDWSREHEQHTLPHQMPLSLNGISTLLTKGGVYNEYVPSFTYQSAKEDMIRHLKTGNPVIIEVRRKSRKTGKLSKRWTNSYHTMIFLGIYPNGDVLLCDSVDRSWYKGGQRYKIVSMDDVMEYMFSSTRTTSKIYYDGAASDGGYIKIFGEKP